ncbi:hypothetical protein K8W59_11085 [Nocardioides rotundus]|nr:hypothetical protein [Nocardioides rotundus]UAL28424.1 hypothetical protein K8W59_11085 [Nocardioides rotundus]
MSIELHDSRWPVDANPSDIPREFVDALRDWLEQEDERWQESNASADPAT